MRKSLFILSVFILSAFVALPSVFGQKSERIKFKSGATEATISGKLNGYKDKKVYVIKVLKGQTLTTEQLSSASSLHYISVSIINPAGEEISDSDASCNDQKEVNPTEAGDYKIIVYECAKADAWRGKFRVVVSVK